MVTEKARYATVRKQGQYACRYVKIGNIQQ